MKNVSNFKIEPPRGLLQKILKRIRKEERLLLLRRIIIFSILLVGSVAGFVPAFNALVADFNHSGFINFFSLIFSDFSVVSAYWKSFAMILLETLPALSLAIFLAVLLVLLESIKYLTKDVKTIIKNLAY